MSLFVSYIFICFIFSNFQEHNVVLAGSDPCTVKEFGSLDETLSYSLSMINVDQEGHFPLKPKPPYDDRNCYEISRVVVKVYNPTNKPKIGLMYLSHPIIYAYVHYGLWQQFISNVDVLAFSFPALTCGDDVIDTGPWGKGNNTGGGNKKPRNIPKNDDTK